jgi:hypothetical protein
MRANILYDFLSLNFLKKERKLFRTPQTSFLMLEAKQINSSATPKKIPLSFEKMVHFLILLQFQAHGNGKMKGIT